MSEDTKVILGGIVFGLYVGLSIGGVSGFYIGKDVTQKNIAEKFMKLDQKTINSIEKQLKRERYEGLE